MTFVFYNPVKIDFGMNSLNRLPKWLNGRSALLVTSEGFVRRGLAERIVSENSSIMKTVSNVQPNPTLIELESMYKSVDFSQFDVIVALGGGSVIDTAKVLSVGSTDYGFEVVRKVILNGQADVELTYKPIIAVPTTTGSGSELTPWGTVWDEVNKKKYSIHTERLWCEIAIYDPLLTITLPRELTIQTGLDALSHSLESIWNANANPLSSQYAIQAIQKITDTLPKLLADLSNEKLRADMMLAVMNASLAFSNTQTAIAHAMSYYMTLHKNIPHGIAVSITLPDIIEEAMKIEEVYGKMKLALGDNPAKTVTHLLDECGISYRYEDYKLTMGDFEAIEYSLNSTTRTKNSLIDSGLLIQKLKNRLLQ